MRLTRCSVVLFSTAAATLIGCGGDDGGGVVVADAKVFMDAPSATVDALPACVVPATIPAGTVGTMAMPVAGKLINKDATSGDIYFGVAITLDSGGKTAVDIFVNRPANGFQTNTPYTFDPNPTNMAAPNVAFLEDNIDAAGNAARLLWASNGSITFSAIGQTMGSAITGTVSMTNFREVDDNGADVAGGCTSTLTGLTIYGQQNTTIAFEVPSGSMTDWRNAKAEQVVAKQQNL